MILTGQQPLFIIEHEDVACLQQTEQSRPSLCSCQPPPQMLFQHSASSNATKCNQFKVNCSTQYFLAESQLSINWVLSCYLNGTESAVFLVANFLHCAKKLFEKKTIRSRFPYFVKKIAKIRIKRMTKMHHNYLQHESRVFLKKEFSSFGEFSQKGNCKKSPCFQTLFKQGSQDDIKGF